MFMELFNNSNINSSFATHLYGHLHPLQVDNCDSNSRPVVDENDHVKFRLDKVIEASRQQIV